MAQAQDYYPIRATQAGYTPSVSSGDQQWQYPLPQIPTPANLTLGDAVMEVLRKFATFNGRATRSEYWWWALVHILFFSFTPFLLTIIAVIMIAISGFLAFIPVFLWLIWMVAFVVAFIPTLAVTVRRLHDTGRSGAHYLLAFIPFIGAIIVLIFLLEESQPMDNQYGLAPRRL